MNNVRSVSPLLDCMIEAADPNGYLNPNLLQGMDESVNRGILPSQPAMQVRQPHVTHQIMPNNAPIDVPQGDVRMILMNQQMIKERWEQLEI